MQNTDHQFLDRRFRAWARVRSQKDPAFEDVLRVTDYAQKHHEGIRENGDPEFSHQLWIVNKFSDIVDQSERAGKPPMKDLANAFKIMLCHDILEDTRVKRSELRNVIGGRAELGVFGMSKKYHDENGNFVRKNDKQAQADLISDPLTLIGKFIDRSHNLGTMVEFDDNKMVTQVVYPPDKQLAKLKEAAFSFITAGEDIALDERFASPDKFPLYDDPDCRPYLDASRQVLIETVSTCIASAVYADVQHTFRGWTNEPHLTGLFNALENSVRMPDKMMYQASPIPPRPVSMFERLATRIGWFGFASGMSSATKKSPTPKEAGLQ